MYKVISHTHACHNILFNDQIMAMESFMLIGLRSTADHICSILNVSLNQPRDANITLCDLCSYQPVEKRCRICKDGSCYKRVEPAKPGVWRDISFCKSKTCNYLIGELCTRDLSGCFYDIEDESRINNED
jgi:hypothetical protein